MRTRMMLIALGMVAAIAAPASAQTTDKACPDGRVPDHGFTDVSDSDPHRTAIDCVVWWSIAQGSSATTYKPGEPVSRAQMATFVARMMTAGGASLPSSPADAFTDDEGSPHETAVNQLADLGIVGGTGEGRYSPSAPVTRAQMATFLVRAYEHTSDVDLKATRDHFDDDNGSSHEDNINKAAQAGFASGTGGTSYSPAGAVLRNQMATFVARVLDRFVRDGRAEPPRSFGEGTWRVPSEVSPGIYRNSDSSETCYWERLSGFSGETSDINANDIANYIMMVEISDTDAGFGSERCGIWSTDLTARKAPEAAFSDGMWLVGSEVAAGTWRNSDSSDTCYWERLSGFSGETSDIIANDIGDNIMTVTIEASDVGFTSSRCGTWTRID